jgi:dsRNA-specific ribonuclease
VPALYHFCSTLNAGAFIDLRPQFAFEEETDTGLVVAIVTLPTVVDPSLRTSRSSSPYRTERMAKRDAAFEAYVALYKAGLVNENLMPIIKSPGSFEDSLQIDKKASLRSGEPRINPWIPVAKMTDVAERVWYRMLITASHGSEVTRVTMCSPSPVPIESSSFPLYWDRETQYEVSLIPLAPYSYNKEDVISAQRITSKFYASGNYPKLDTGKTDFLVYFLPEPDIHTSLLKHQWTHLQNSERDEISELNTGIVTLEGNTNANKRFPEKFFFKRWPSASASESDEAQVILTDIPKGKNFLHPIAAGTKPFTKETTQPIARCNFGHVPLRYCKFSFFIPSILRRVELALVADNLRLSVLEPVGIKNCSLVQTAITHTAACELENYQRLEFLGDCILKYYTSLQLVAEYPSWPEGYLTQRKSVQVSNTALETTCRRLGLDRYIINDNFTGSGWLPTYVHELSAARTTGEDVVLRPSKMLADVVESLIAVAYADGDLPKALRCIEVFFPDQFRLSPEDALATINNTARGDEVHLAGLERVVGRDFTNKKLLLEAVTHGSFHSYKSAIVRSYEVLEFLGDACLDYLVVRRLWASEPSLSHRAMHTTRTTLVNAWILGVLCMEHSVSEPTNFVVRVEGSSEFRSESQSIEKHIWEWMRHSVPAITATQQEKQKKYGDMHGEIWSALRCGKKYPWSVLARLNPDKFYSDLVESLISAIYIDSCGDFEQCDAFLERLGLWKIMDRLLIDDVDVVHPKEKLGILAVSDKVEYVKRFHEGKWYCQVRVGERDVGDTVEGYGRADMVETEAATRAVIILEEEKNELEKKRRSKAHDNNENADTEQVKEDEEHEREKRFEMDCKDMGSNGEVHSLLDSSDAEADPTTEVWETEHMEKDGSGQ